jgi:hypothetical protein
MATQIQREARGGNPLLGERGTTLTQLVGM